MQWFDKGDARLAAKAVVLLGAGSVLLLTIATVFGLAWRVLNMAAG